MGGANDTTANTTAATPVETKAPAGDDEEATADDDEAAGDDDEEFMFITKRLLRTVNKYMHMRGDDNEEFVEDA